MSLQAENIPTPLQTNRALYSKYSSSQTYYYSNITSEIVKQKRTAVNITYEDMEYYCDSEEYFKRFYQHQQFPGKMFTFKEYYFYHEDCPRIFMKTIQELYSKWQDRRRDLVYKKLKILYNESFSSSRSSTKDEDNKSATGITHFLLQISDYNPFSKKYYLRVQAKKLQTKQNQKDKNHSAKDLSSLNHELSMMLNDISQLSSISTLQQQQSPRFSNLYHPKKLKVNYSSEYSTHHNSQSNSNTHSTIKFNFKKKKDSAKDKQKIHDQFHKKLQIKDKSQQRSNNYPGRVSPKFLDKQKDNKFSKTKSIFQISSFNSNKRSQMVLNLNINSNKKQNLKLKSDKKPQKAQNRISIQSKAMKRYDSQKKVLIQSQSNRKMTQLQPLGPQKNLYQSLGKKNSILASSQSNLKPIPRQGSLRQDIVTGLISHGNQFSDVKLIKTQDSKIRSHKSEYFSAPKQNNLPRANSPAKLSFKIHTQKKPNNKQKLHIQIGKKSQQLKIQ